MPGFVVHQGAVVLCTHAGMATPTAVNPRVTVSGLPTVVATVPYAVAGCTFPAMAPGSPPCATANWTTGATRVTSNGQPLVLIDSVGICVPTGTPLVISGTQPRVTAI